MRNDVAAGCLVALAFLPAVEASAQDVAPRGDAGRAVTVSIGYELHLDRLRYTFENPSNVTTSFLVPHEFTQSYAAGNQWLVGAVRYPIGPEHLATEFGITPERVTSGSDFDTFYNPDGNIIVWGTDGDVRLRSLRFAQWSETTLFGLPWRLGYRYRRDRSQFLPTDRIVTQTQPPSEERSPTFGRETTISDIHAIPLEVSRRSAIGSGWSMALRGEVSPIMVARLTTILPDKYPGQDIVFVAKAFGYGAGLELQRTTTRWPVTVAVRFARTGSYADARQLALNSLQVVATLGTR